MDAASWNAPGKTMPSWYTVRCLPQLRTAQRQTVERVRFTSAELVLSFSAVDECRQMIRPTTTLRHTTSALRDQTWLVLESRLREGAANPVICSTRYGRFRFGLHHSSCREQISHHVSHDGIGTIDRDSVGGGEHTFLACSQKW